jgi:prepilin-type N-terminal cleavage/methylation domain-containing protein
MKRFREHLGRPLKADQGFTLVELAVSLGILSIVMTLAFSILISTMNISSVVSWQSTSNTELRQLIDSVFADVETARPALGCDGNHDGQITLLTEKVLTSSCDLNNIVEQPGAVLLVASPDRICYNTNRLLSRQAGTLPGSTNPPYAPVCLAVVPVAGGQRLELRLEMFNPAAGLSDWNGLITTGARPPDGIRVLGRVDPSAASPTGDGYFEYYKVDSLTGAKVMLTGSAPGVRVGAIDIPNALTDDDRKLVNTVVMRARIAYGATGAQAKRTRDIVYRIALRAARYSSERCATGNLDAGATCSS